MERRYRQLKQKAKTRKMTEDEFKMHLESAAQATAGKKGMRIKGLTETELLERVIRHKRIERIRQRRDERRVRKDAERSFRQQAEFFERTGTYQPPPAGQTSDMQLQMFPSAETGATAGASRSTSFPVARPWPPAAGSGSPVRSVSIPMGPQVAVSAGAFPQIGRSPTGVPSQLLPSEGAPAAAGTGAPAAAAAVGVAPHAFAYPYPMAMAPATAGRPPYATDTTGMAAAQWPWTAGTDGVPMAIGPDGLPVSAVVGGVVRQFESKRGPRQRDTALLALSYPARVAEMVRQVITRPMMVVTEEQLKQGYLRSAGFFEFLPLRAFINANLRHTGRILPAKDIEVPLSLHIGAFVLSIILCTLPFIGNTYNYIGYMYVYICIDSL